MPRGLIPVLIFALTAILFFGLGNLLAARQTATSESEQLAVLRHGDEVTKDVVPGKHRLHVHNTLFSKNVDFTLNVGEHAIYRVVNRAGFLTYSVFAFFLGGGPLYLSVEREGASVNGR